VIDEYQKTHRAIVLNMSAHLIENLVTLLGEDGIEIEPIDMKQNGEPIGAISPSQLAAQLREMADELKPMRFESAREDNTDDGEGDDD
jgi:hypothetical protein